jgi:hypothetical protein
MVFSHAVIGTHKVSLPLNKSTNMAKNISSFNVIWTFWKTLFFSLLKS